MNDDEDYLTANPSYERSLFMDWVLTCFQWEKTSPTPEELETIRNRWYPGAKPINAVSDAIRRREK